MDTNSPFTLSEIPVLLLTGYLGSGKTTLLNRILSNERGIKFAVIVNDIGEVNIDARLIEQGGVVDQQDDSLVPLQNGCICCTLKMDLVKQLSDLVALRRFDYIVIEASGICEPAPIAQTICSMPTMAPEYCKAGVPRLDCIATVVDALRLKDEFQGGLDLRRPNIAEDDLENLVVQQIEFCNLILLNKAADVTPKELERTRQVLRAIQPKARIVECNYCDVDLDLLLNTHLFDFDRVATSAAWIDAIENDHDAEDHDHEGGCHEHDGENGDHECGCHGHDGEKDAHKCGCHHHHHHHEGGEVEEYGIGTYVYSRRRPFDLARFDEFVARFWPQGIIRAKGICWFRDEPQTCYVFEQAGRQVGLRNAGQWYATMPKDELENLMAHDATLRRDWDEAYGDRMQKLVFIGQHLDGEAIAQALDRCLRD